MKKVVLVVVAALLAGGIIYYLNACPCERLPYLSAVQSVTASIGRVLLWNIQTDALELLAKSILFLSRGLKMTHHWIGLGWHG